MSAGDSETVTIRLPAGVCLLPRVNDRRLTVRRSDSVAHAVNFFNARSFMVQNENFAMHM